MAPFLPVLSLSRSQKLRFGRTNQGSAQAVPQMLGFPTKGTLNTVFYVDMGDPATARDLQRHMAIGSVLIVGDLVTTVTSDLYTSDDIDVAAGSGTTVDISAGTLKSRAYGTTLAYAGKTGVPIAAADANEDRQDWLGLDNQGTVWYVQGTDVTSAGVSFTQTTAGVNTYEVMTVGHTGTVSGGAGYTLSFVWNGNTYTTAAIAYNALPAAVATAMLAATGGPALGAGTLTGSGTAPNSGTATITASGSTAGPITGFAVGGTVTGGGAITFAETTPGVLTYEVDKVQLSNTPAGGTFTLTFTWATNVYTTAAIAYNATSTAVANAIIAATGVPAGTIPGGSVAGSGGPLPAAVTLTTSGAFRGPVTAQTSASLLTVGATSSTPVNVMPLATIYVPTGAASSSAYTITDIAPTS